MFTEIYNDVNAIIKRFACFNNNVYFTKIYCKDVFIKDVIITKCVGVMLRKLSYNEDNEDDENIIIIMSYNDIISASYSCIKFITLFKYLTLYYISNFDS